MSTPAPTKATSTRPAPADGAGVARVAALVGVASILFAVYAVSGPRTLPEADAAEFAAIAVRGGIPHPPGYPLLALVLQLFAPLAPVLGLVPALSLSSIVFGCAAACLLVRVLLERGFTPFVASTSVLAVFLSCNLWRAITTFEPFALNLLLAACVIAATHALARVDDSAGKHGASARLCFGIGALFGLGLCNHHSLATLAPLPALVLSLRPRQLARRCLPLLLGFGCGALPLLAFLLLREQHGFIWGTWRPFWPQLIAHVLRRDYGSLSLAAHEHGSSAYGPLRLLTTLPRVLSFVFFAVLVAGLSAGVRGLVRAWRARRAADDGFALGLTASFAVAGLLFPALFRLSGTALDALISDRFFALPALLLFYPLARGVSVLENVRWGRSCALLLLLGHLVWQWPLAARTQHRFYEAHLRNILASVDHGATVMTVGDQGFFGGIFARYVWGRDDLIVVGSGVNLPWYAARIKAELARVGPALRSHPLYLLDIPSSHAGASLRSYPIGPLLRVLAPAESMPAAETLFARNAELFAKLRLPTRAEVLSADAWEADEIKDYYRTWQLIAERLQASGQTDLARRAEQFRDAFAPGGPGG